MSEESKDRIYQEPLGDVNAFQFDARVAAVFDDMIPRSVPLYADVQELSAALVRQHARSGSRVWDLGCSTGTTLLGFLPELDLGVRVIGLDASGDMLKVCRRKLDEAGFLDRVDLLESRMEEAEIENASVVLMNYTLQFLPPEGRLDALQKIRAGMLPGSVLLISEKIRHVDPVSQGTLTDVHHQFKRRNGYSELEVAQKREAIEHVLIPLTVEMNEKLFREAGFSRHELLLKWTVFASWVVWA